MEENTITEEIATYLNRFMAFKDNDQPLAIALWVLHTHTFGDSFPFGPWTTPYLYVHSSESRSGKTTLIELLEPLVLNAERATDMTSSSMFRLIETVQPALFVDEVDAVFNGAKNEGMRGVLNGGYKRGGYVWRTTGGEPEKFNTFCAKLLAGIDNGQMPETVHSRCLPIHLRRMENVADRETYYPWLAGPDSEALGAAIVEFIREYGQKGNLQYLPKPIEGINPRNFEVVMPLLQIAHYLGIEDTAREAFHRLFTTVAVRETTETIVLRRIKELFDTRNTDRLHSATICAELEGGWNGKLLAKRITEPLEIGSPTVFTTDGRTSRGYYRWQFETAFKAYLGE
jgi:hypothetical protein